MKLTAQIKLLPTPEQASLLLGTLRAVNAAATFAAEQGFTDKVYSQASIHRLTYRTLRERFGLSAQHAVRAISKAVEAFQRDKTRCPAFHPEGAIALDDRLYRLLGLHTASINTTAGRIRCPFVVGDYFAGMLSRKMGQADLVHRDGQFFVYVSVEFQEEPALEPKEWIGIDLGIANLATDSTGETFSGKDVDRHRRRHATARKQHQRKGTKNARRKLRRMSGKQRRYQHWMNHRISKRLVEKARHEGAGIVLEDLKGIRARLQDTVSEAFRHRLGNWSFHHLRVCIEYKAKRVGVPVVTVSPRNTSRTCSACGYCAKGNRPDQATFCCLQCGHSSNADLNAALNLSALGASVSRPQKVQESRVPLTDS